MREVGWPQVLSAIHFDRWNRLADEQAARAAAGLNASTEWQQALAQRASTPAQAGLRCAVERCHGQACFDHDFYLASNADLRFARRLPSAAAWAWEHFLRFGLEEARPHRWTC